MFESDFLKPSLYACHISVMSLVRHKTDANTISTTEKNLYGMDALA